MPPTLWWARLRLGCSAAEAGAGHSSRSTLLSNARTKCVADRFRVEIDSSFSKAGYTRSRPLGLTGVQPSRPFFLDHKRDIVTDLIFDLRASVTRKSLRVPEQVG